MCSVHRALKVLRPISTVGCKTTQKGLRQGNQNLKTHIFWNRKTAGNFLVSESLYVLRCCWEDDMHPNRIAIIHDDWDFTWKEKVLHLYLNTYEFSHRFLARLDDPSGGNKACIFGQHAIMDIYITHMYQALYQIRKFDVDGSAVSLWDTIFEWAKGLPILTQRDSPHLPLRA